MTRWWAAAGLAGVVLLALLSLSRASQRAITDRSARGRRPTGNVPGGESDTTRPGPVHDRSGDGSSGVARQAGEHPDSGEAHGPEWVPESVAGTGTDDLSESRPGHPTSHRPLPPPGPPGANPPGSHLSTRVLLANVAVTQGLFLVVLAAGLALFAVPPGALGLVPTTATHLSLGAALGTGLYLANEVGAAAADRAGIGHDERLRELLAPDSVVGWLALLFVALPVVAGFEELLFRGVLVGVLSTGFDVSPWLLAALSSVAFGFGHGAQGTAGVLVTGALGFVLAAAYVLTGSLAVVVVAHYLVNALEFVVHEALGVDVGGRIAGGS